MAKAFSGFRPEPRRAPCPAHGCGNADSTLPRPRAGYNKDVTAGLNRRPGYSSLPPLLAQIFPLRIEFHYKCILPFTLPILQLLFAGNGDDNIIMLFEPNELFAIVPSGEGGRIFVLLVFGYIRPGSSLVTPVYSALFQRLAIMYTQDCCMEGK